MPSFEASAICLDNARLGKQRVEVLQLLNALTGKSKGWQNHPCVKMWQYYQDALVAYGLEMCLEWTRRGFADSCFYKIYSMRTTSFLPTQGNVPMPDWLGNAQFHSSHRGNLLRKDPKWYRQFGWQDSPLLFYVWPVSRPYLGNGQLKSLSPSQESGK